MRSSSPSSPTGRPSGGASLRPWDGRTWTRSDTDFQTLRGPGLVRLAEDDLGARGDDVVVQRVTVEIRIRRGGVRHPHARSCLESIRPVRQRADGTLVRRRDHGSGHDLRRDQPARAVAARATARGGRRPGPPRPWPRIRPTADDHRPGAGPGAEIIAGATTDYDGILSHARWMDTNTEYSLDAPLAPRGSTSSTTSCSSPSWGWCEQIATPRRHGAPRGVPARLVTGFVPGDGMRSGAIHGPRT